MNIIAPQFWSDPKVQALDATGKILLVCMITDDQVNLPGLFWIGGPEHYWSKLKGVPHPDVESAFLGLVESAIAIFDPGHGVLRLPNVWKYAPGPNPAQVRGWKTNWVKIPDCQARYDHLETLKKLAYRKKSVPVIEAYEAIFGHVVPFAHDSYELGNGFLLEKRRREARNLEQTPGSNRSGSSSSSRNSTFTTTPEDPEEKRTLTRTKTTTRTKTITNGLPEGLGEGHVEGLSESLPEGLRTNLELIPGGRGNSAENEPIRGSSRGSHQRSPGYQATGPTSDFGGALGKKSGARKYDSEETDR